LESSSIPYNKKTQAEGLNDPIDYPAWKKITSTKKNCWNGDL